MTRPLCSIARLSEMVTTICDAALTSASIETASNQQVPGWERLLRHPDLYRNFKYSLADNVAKLLGTHDKYVQSVYFLAPSIDPNREANQQFSPETTLYLLVMVDKRSAALDAFIEALGRSLNHHLHELLSPLSADCQTMLDIVIVTEEIHKHRGYTYLVARSFVPSIKLWKRSV